MNFVVTVTYRTRVERTVVQARDLGHATGHVYWGPTLQDVDVVSLTVEQTEEPFTVSLMKAKETTR